MYNCYALASLLMMISGGISSWYCFPPPLDFENGYIDSTIYSNKENKAFSILDYLHAVELIHLCIEKCCNVTILTR